MKSQIDTLISFLIFRCLTQLFFFVNLNFVMSNYILILATLKYSYFII